MLFYKFKSLKQVNVNINRYTIDWDLSPSKEQQILQDFLKPYWFNKVILAEFWMPGSLFRVDLLNVSDRIAVEYSPNSTHDYNPFFHKTRAQFLKRVKSDIDKIEELERNGFKVIEINKEDLDWLSPKYFREKFQINL